MSNEQPIISTKEIFQFTALFLIVLVVVMGVVAACLHNAPSHDDEANQYRQRFEQEIKACEDKGGVPIRDWAGVKLKDCKFPGATR
jgi:hypothetical protein